MMTLENAREKMNTNTKFKQFVQMYCLIHMVETKEDIYLNELLPGLADFYEKNSGKNILEI